LVGSIHVLRPLGRPEEVPEAGRPAGDGLDGPDELGVTEREKRRRGEVAYAQDIVHGPGQLQVPEIRPFALVHGQGVGRLEHAQGLDETDGLPLKGGLVG